MARPPWTQTIAQKQSQGILQQKFQTGLNLHRQGKLSDAAKLYEAVIKHNQEHFDALHLLGVICAQTRQFGRAAELISKAIKIDPENAEAYSNRGAALKELGRFTTRLFDCQRFTKDIESAYCAMFERYSNNLPPDHIFLQPQESVSGHF